MRNGETADVTRAQEDFLKITYQFQSEGKPVTNSEIAAAMDLTPAAISGMAKRLGDLGLLVYHKYQDLELTPRGQLIALEVLRHHRLLELFLTETLNMPWELVHAIADRLEHVLDEVLEDAIDDHLQNPSIDPHGDPIPAKDGTMPWISTALLVEQPLCMEHEVARVLTQEEEKLSYLGHIGLRPRAKVSVQEKMPFDGPLRLLVNGVETVIGHDIARMIVVANPKGS